MFPVATKGGGLCVAFPDVCKTPVPVVGIVPIPYPNIAKTAQAAQKANKVPVGGVSKATATGGNKADVSGEVAQLKSALNQLNAKLMGLQSDDPNKWQEVLSDYCVAASALYVTMRAAHALLLTTIQNMKA